MAGFLSVVGAGALLVGLSLDWFEPEISAWTAFELVDVLLAAIALSVVFGAMTRTVDRPGGTPGATWLPIAALAALVLVVTSLANHPPAVIDRSLEVGAWISLGGAILLVIAAILATTELSVVVTMRPRRRSEAVGSPAAVEPDWDQPDEPLEEPYDEPVTDEGPIAQEPEPGDEPAGPTEPIEEGIVPDDEVEAVPPDPELGLVDEPPGEGETQPFPPPRRVD